MTPFIAAFDHQGYDCVRGVAMMAAGASGPRAAINGRSMEDEARDILRSALCTDEPRPRNLAHAIHQRFGPLSGVDLLEVRREAIRPPVHFGE